MLGEIDKAASKSKAPFLKSDLQPAIARSQWSNVFEKLSRSAALDRAISAAKSDLAGRDGMISLERMKAERDALKRLIGLGTDWVDGGS